MEQNSPNATEKFFEYEKEKKEGSKKNCLMVDISSAFDQDFAHVY